ncbi:MAG: hypothetical protein HC875_03160 [Anaerolineales bacterium]|nr:hypothetical protein [Anaerolineales bacterium]
MNRRILDALLCPAAPQRPVALFAHLATAPAHLSALSGYPQPDYSALHSLAEL